MLPRLLPRILPDDWKGGFVLLALVFVLSAFLDNIAAAIIGATVAATVYQHKLHIGYPRGASSRRPTRAARAAWSATPPPR